MDRVFGWANDRITGVMCGKTKGFAAFFLQHKRYSGGHDLTQERFRFIIEWMVKMQVQNERQK